MTPRYSIDPADTDGGMTTAAIEKDIERATALMQLRGLGDDGTALRCAVMIAQAGAGEDTVAEFCEQIARGEDVNVAARAEKAEQEMSAYRSTRNYWVERAGRAEREIAKAETKRCLTAREHLDAAWDAAYEPEGHIPARTPMIVRTVGTGELHTEHAGGRGASAETWMGETLIWERRLLDTPEPARDPEAEKLDPTITAAIRGHSDITSPTVVHAIADALADEGVRAPEAKS